METIRSLGLISTQSAASRLDCTVQHVRLLIKAGRIQGERIGRDWFANEQSVCKFEETRYQPKRSESSTVNEAQVESLFSEVELQGIVNVASVPQRSPFRYPGGKTWLIPIARLWLGSLKPNAALLIEPFAGGGGIGLTSAFEGYTATSLLAELDPDIGAVWQVMVDGDGPNLANKIRNFSLNETKVRQELAGQPSTLLGRAFQTILRNRVSRGGILAPGAGLIKSGEAGRGLASRWYPETLAKRIEAIHERRSSLRFQEGDGLEVMSQYQNDPNACFFVDPPYPEAGRRLYRFHDLDHRQLFRILSGLQGSFLATYNDNLLIESLAQDFGFETRRVPMKSTHHAKKMELLVSRSFEWLPLGIND